MRTSTRRRKDCSAACGEPSDEGSQVAGRGPRGLIRLSIRAATADAEHVNAALLELAPTGFEQVDGDGFVEFALYGAPGELPSLPAGDAEVGGARVRVRGEDVPDDWAERWKRFHAPVLIGRRVYPCP